jgi:hypothetical protein
MSDDDDSGDSWGRVADAVEEMRMRLSEDREVPHYIDREELAEGIRNAIEQLVENGAVGDKLAVEIGSSERNPAETQIINQPAT